MNRSTNPFVEGGEGVFGVPGPTLIRATVTNADPDNEKVHIVEVKPEGFDTAFPAELPVEMVGDAHVPTENAKVLLGLKSTGGLTVITQRYGGQPNQIPSYEAGERVIGHPLSDTQIRLDVNGDAHIRHESGMTVTVDASGVHVNGGTKNAVSDITTTKNADGYVTDVDVKRSDSVYI